MNCSDPWFIFHLIPVTRSITFWFCEYSTVYWRNRKYDSFSDDHEIWSHKQSHLLFLLDIPCSSINFSLMSHHRTKRYFIKSVQLQPCLCQSSNHHESLNISSRLSISNVMDNTVQYYLAYLKIPVEYIKFNDEE